MERLQGWTPEDEAEHQALEAARELDPEEEEHGPHCQCPEHRADNKDPDE